MKSFGSGLTADLNERYFRYLTNCYRRYFNKSITLFLLPQDSLLFKKNSCFGLKRLEANI
jgi:hypothetical protein